MGASMMMVSLETSVFPRSILHHSAGWGHAALVQHGSLHRSIRIALVIVRARVLTLVMMLVSLQAMW